MNRKLFPKTQAQGNPAFDLKYLAKYVLLETAIKKDELYFIKIH